MNNDILASIDENIHTKVRLGIMTLLVTQGRQNFVQLKSLLNVTDGNLSSHLKVLEQIDYIEVHKGFIDRKPRTTYNTTDKGKTGQISNKIRTKRGTNWVPFFILENYTLVPRKTAPRSLGEGVHSCIKTQLGFAEWMMKIAVE